MPTKARRRFIRRDRRKAKQSNWARPGKSNLKKAGHGGSGQMHIKVNLNIVKLKVTFKMDKKINEANLTFNLLEVTEKGVRNKV